MKPFAKHLEAALTETIVHLIEDTGTYEAAKRVKDTLEADHSEASKNFGATRARLMAGQKAGLMGMTPDHVKNHPDFKQASTAYSGARDKLRAFNGPFLKKFNKEYSADIAAQREKRRS